MRDEGSEPRYLCSDLVKLAVEGARPVTVILENISASEACVQSDSAVPESARVELICRGTKFNGVVRCCLPRDDAYFVDIVFDADSQWSIAKYEPRHLLDPREAKPRRAGGKPYVM
jgi:hypothetical protein